MLVSSNVFWQINNLLLPKWIHMLTNICATQEIRFVCSWTEYLAIPSAFWQYFHFTFWLPEGRWNGNDSSCNYSVREQAYKLPTFWRSIKCANNFHFSVDLVNHYIEGMTNNYFCMLHFFPLSTAILLLKCFLNIWRLIQLFVTKSIHGHNNSTRKTEESF